MDHSRGMHLKGNDGRSLRAAFRDKQANAQAERTKNIDSSVIYLSPQDVAELAGCCHRVVRRAVADGSLPSIKWSGRRILIHPDDAATYAAEKVKPDGNRN